jgi:hypothetical protein
MFRNSRPVLFSLVISAILFALTGRPAQALPFTMGSAVPLDIDRYEVGGTEAYTYRLVTVGGVRPSILYGDASFQADEILYDDLSQMITALGNVRVTVGPNQMLGDHLEYSIEAGRGMLTGANMRGGDVQVTGGKIEIREIEVKDRYGVDTAYSFEVRDGSVTACEYTIPHYHVTADFLRVVPKVRVWLYSAVYRVTGVPIFYFPYLTRSLRKQPFAYVIEPGYDSDKGFVVLNRFHFHYNDVIAPWARATVYADGFSKQGLGIGAKWTYMRQPEADSYLHGYWIDQQDDFDEDVDARVKTEGSRGKVAFQHFQRFGNNWTLTGKGKRLSDPDFDEDYREEELKRGFSRDDLESDRDAFVNLAQRKTNSNFRMIYKERLDDFNLLEFPEDERQEVVYDSKRRPFDNTDLFHQYNFSAGHYKSHQTTSSANVDRVVTVAGQDVDIEQEFWRADFGTELNYPFKVSELSIIPFLGYEGTAYSEATRKTRVWEHHQEEQLVPPEVLVESYDGLFRQVVSGGVEFITRQSLRFDDPAEGIERRLLLEPSVRFVGLLPSEEFEDLHPDDVQPQNANPGSPIIRSEMLSKADRPGFPSIDEIDGIRDEFLGFELRLESRLQTRRRGGAPRDLLRGAVSTAVDFTETDEGEEEFSTVFAELFFSPVEWLSYSGFLEYEPQGSYVRSVRNALRWNPRWPFSVEVAYSEYKFDEDADGEEELAVLLDMVLSERYTVTFEQRYDLDDSISRSRRIGVVRDFHDWLLTIGFRESERESRDKSVGAYFSLTLKTPRALEGVLPDNTIQANDEEGVASPI